MMAVLAIVVALVSLTALSGFASPAAPAPRGDSPLAQVVAAERYDTSPALRDIPIKPMGPRTAPENDRRRLPGSPDGRPDPVVQRVAAPNAMPPVIVEWQGINSALCSCAPSDSNIAVGPNHVVETVNGGFQIWNKTGTSIYGPAAINTIFTGFGGACETNDDGDPVVLHDQLADRWVISQFAISGPFYECVAVSQTPDPAGAWNRYAFQTSTTKLNDYPKLSVWPDGYYMTANLFLSPSFSWAGTGAYVMDRTAMLAGGAATMQFFELPPADWGGLLPADLDGVRPPPAGSPNIMIEVVDGAWDPGNWPNDELQVHKFHVDWVTPANTTFNIAPVQVPVAAFDGDPCIGWNRECVPQPGTSRKLDGITDRMMFRLAYRNYGDHDALVVNHTVNAGTTSMQLGIRWYELRDLWGAAPTIYQQGTYGPADGLHRWMASMAMDHVGNIAVGFATGNGTAPNYPSIGYAGRLVTDPLGQMSQGEATMFAGTGSQTSPNRWGDYSSLVIDPSDDCTFWYVGQYYQTNGSFAWRTRIGSFKFPSCVSPTAVESTGVSASSATGAPIGLFVVFGLLVVAGTAAALRLRK